MTQLPLRFGERITHPPYRASYRPSDDTIHLDISADAFPEAGAEVRVTRTEALRLITDMCELLQVTAVPSGPTPEA